MIRRISSGGPWEDAIGYSRAVVAGLVDAYAPGLDDSTSSEPGRVIA